MTANPLRTARVELVLTPDERTLLLAAAEDVGVSVSSLLRMLLREKIAECNALRVRSGRPPLGTPPVVVPPGLSRAGYPKGGRPKGRKEKDELKE